MKYMEVYTLQKAAYKKLMAMILTLAMVITLVPVVTMGAETEIAEQFTLAPGGTYYFDLSAKLNDIKYDSTATINTALPDSSLKWVPFTYAGTVNAYSRTTAGVSTVDNVTTSSHSLFVSDYALNANVSWDGLNSKGLIFGNAGGNYTANGISYNLRSLSVGSTSNGQSGDAIRGIPQSNEWDQILNKNSSYIKYQSGIFCWGQDTLSTNPSIRVGRSWGFIRYFGSNMSTHRAGNDDGFRPTLEILNASIIGSDGIKTVTYDMGGNGRLGNGSLTQASVVYTGTLTLPEVTEANGFKYTGVTHDDLTLGWLSGDGHFYAAGTSLSSLPTGTTLTAGYGVTGVTVAPSPTGIENGASQQFTATVSGSGTYSNTVNWTVSGANSNNTTISSSGMLTVASDEIANTLTVKAASVQNENKFGTATVTVIRTAIIHTTVDGAAADITGDVELRQGETVITTTHSGTGVYKASPADGAYHIFINNKDTGVDLNVSDGTGNATVNYYTVRFSVTDTGMASGSTITAMAAGETIVSGTVVPAGKTVVITATGVGAPAYSYIWTGDGSGGETTALLNINSLTGAVNAVCTVSGTKSTPNISQWPTISPITVGQIFASSMSGGLADVPGTFSIEDADNIPTVGIYTKTITFTPMDPLLYNQVTRSVSVTVNSTSNTAGNGNTYNVTPLSPVASVIVNGETLNAGTSQTTTVNGLTTTTVTVDDQILQQILNAKGNNTTVVIPVNTGSDVASGILTGQMVKNMETTRATLIVETNTATYTLPASEINIEAVSAQLGKNVSLSDISVEIRIAEPPANTGRVVENSAQAEGFSIVVPAVDFDISCSYNGQTTQVSSFNTYVERTIAIPDGVTPSKITTGIVVNPDGTTRHVPTKITVIDGKYYAVINSLTNSTYAVVWHPVEFADVTEHWAKAAVNDLGSRMIITGIGGQNYAPDSYITRAEFAVILVRALGLVPEAGKSRFSDVTASDWYCGYVETAFSHGMITGYGNGTFGPNDKITREQAMDIVARALKITAMDTSIARDEVSTILAGYSDANSISVYAKAGVAICLKTGVITGGDTNIIAPKVCITRAEVAVIVRQMLKKSNLI